MTQNQQDEQQPVAHVGDQRIGAVYAEALLNSATRQHQASEILEELQSLVQDVFAASPSFEAFLASAVVGREHKVPILRQAFAERASPLFLNFLLVLNDHDRLYLLRHIFITYRELFNERHRRVRVFVRSAVPLPEDQRERLQQELRQTLQREPILDARIDPDLLGGLIIQVGDWIYDGSIRTRLSDIRNQILERSSYEIQSGRDRFSYQ